MIDYKKSAEINNCSEEYLMEWFSKYPVSGKKIIVRCDVCGKEREICFYNYRDLCQKCSLNTVEYCKKRSVIATEIWNDVSRREAQSKWRIDYYKEHPEARDAARDKTIEQFSDEKAREAASLKTIEQFSDPEMRAKQSDILKSSDAHKAYIETTKGGNDIVNHHIAYDFMRPQTLIVKITRKFHSMIHHPRGIQFSTRGYSLID